MKYTIHFEPGLKDGVKALLPENSRIIVENRLCVIVESELSWKIMNKIYNDIAIVGECKQKEPVLN
jgi:hypothetical protein